MADGAPAGEIADLGDWDYIIIGAGSAGCLLANRLSADPSNRVLLLEAGGRDSWIWIHIPVGYLYCMGDPRTDWLYKLAPEAGLGGRALNYPRGRVLGGCSSINGMIYMRGQAADYDHWRQGGCEGWSWDEVLPYFKRHEDYGEGGDAMHGAGGELRVDRQRLSWEILDAFADAAAEAGLPRTEDFNRGDNEGVGYFRVTQRGGWRLNASQAFLKPVRNRPNLRVLTNAQAERLIISEGRVQGLRLRWNGRPAEARAQGETVLSAGAIGSPQLLQISGVGDAEALRELDLPVILDRPAVGGNLQDHLQLRLIYRVEGVETLNQRAGSLFGQARIALEYAISRSGPMSMAPSQLGAFAKSDPERATANLEYHVQPLSLDKFGDPLHDFPAFTASVCNLRPTSRGSVRLAAPEPTTAPVIQPNYLSTPEDRRVAADAIRLTRRIASQPALARYRPEEYLPGMGADSDEALAEAAGRIGTTIFHPVGTCRMGSDPDAVVDPRLRLRGLEGLRVVDASVMPSITSGNTAAPTMMIAEKAASMMLEDQKTVRTPARSITADSP